VANFSVVRQRPAYSSGMYQVFLLPANDQPIRLVCISDFGVSPPEIARYLTPILYIIPFRKAIPCQQMTTGAKTLKKKLYLIYLAFQLLCFYLCIICLFLLF